MKVAFLILGGAVVALLGLLLISSIHERRRRAAVIATAALIVFAAGWAGLLWAAGQTGGAAGVALLILPGAGLLIAGLLFFAPLAHTSRIPVGAIETRVDERDVIFAREEYRPGTEKYRQYYQQHPERKALDDELRALPELLAPGGRFYDPRDSAEIDRIFSVIEDLTTSVDGPTAEGRQPADPRRMTATIKTLVRRLGADDVGIAQLNPQFVYAHVGRGPEPWGAPIELHHRLAVVFTVEMDFTAVAQAPRLPITREAAHQYLKAAQISVALASHIRTLGYPARAHIAGSNYQIMLPPVAHDAGLGELGRMGYLISPRLGGRIRLGGVTTDLPLVPGRPIAFGVQDFCERCRKCAINCPSGAIPSGPRSTVRGVEKWPLDIEQCLRYWRLVGTDCGLCMRVCPFSHPGTLVHRLVRAGVRHSPIARRISIAGDDLLYGRRVQIR